MLNLVQHLVTSAILTLKQVQGDVKGFLRWLLELLNLIELKRRPAKTRRLLYFRPLHSLSSGCRSATTIERRNIGRRVEYHPSANAKSDGRKIFQERIHLIDISFPPSNETGAVTSRRLTYMYLPKYFPLQT